MHQQTTPSAVSALTALVNSNALASQYEDYVERHIRNADSFYRSILVKEGQEAAEAALDRYNRSQRRSDYAAAVAPVAQGLLALALANSDCIEAVEGGDEAKGKLFIMLNQPVQRRGSVLLPGEENWGPYGRLRLKAIKLRAGFNSQQKGFGELSLFLPLRSADECPNSEGFVSVSIYLDGYTTTSSSEPRLAKNGFLKYELGLVGAEDVFKRLMLGGGDIDTAVGFPGAIDYLATALPELGRYLSALAAQHKA